MIPASFTPDGLVADFFGILSSEYGSIAKEDREFMEPLIRSTWATEGHLITYEELDSLLCGVNEQGEDGVFTGEINVPPHLEEKYPRLNIIAQYGIAYDENEVIERLARYP